MKKNYFMLAAATMMLAACAETELVNEVNVESTPQAIGFETFANKATRATENSNAATTWDLEDHHSNFNVWASKEITTGNYVEVWASGTPGTATLVSGSWTPAPKKYWDKAALNYHFYAAAPADLGWIYSNATSGNGSTGFLKLNSYTLQGTANDNLATNTDDDHESWGSTLGNDVDLMIAEECSKDRDSYKSAAPANVALVFDHILSRLNILVKKTGDATIVVKALDVCKLNNSGAFNENGATIDPAVGSFGRWTPTSSTYTLSMYGAPLTLSSTAVYTHEYLVIPQAQQNTEETVNQGVAPATDAYIYINYTVNGEEYHTYYGLAQVFGVAKDSNLAFNEGWQNTLTINIAPDEILFNANVALWADPTPTPGLEIE